MSNIEWTDTTWNPVIGCTPVSPGCLNCYAATMARRLEAMGKAEYLPSDWAFARPGEGEHERRARVGDVPEKMIRIAEVRGGRAVFTGEVRTLEGRLTEPLHWRKPRRVFVNSMSDLFHEDVPFEFIDRVFAVMALCRQHTFQVLTKRPERMAEYFRSIALDRTRHDQMNEFANSISTPPDNDICINREWPHSNVWLGASVENQATADERIPHLLKCPAAVRFLSCEPLLEAVDLSAFMGGAYVGLPGDVVHPNYNAGLHWVIVGGESGANARPCRVELIRSIVRQCRAASVPVFVKQLGAKVVDDEDANAFRCPRCKVRREDYDVLGLDDGYCCCHECGEIVKVDDNLLRHDGKGYMRPHDRKGGDPDEWPEDLRVREWPQGAGHRDPSKPDQQGEPT